MKKENLQISYEDYRIAQQVALGTVRDSSSMGIFNRVYKILSSYISQKYDIEPENNIRESNNKKKYKKKIVVPSSFINDAPDAGSDNSEGNARDVEISIGEFILESLKNWRAEKSEYLTYIQRLLKNWNFRVPESVNVNKVREQRNACRLIQDKFKLRSCTKVEALEYICNHPELFTDDERYTYYLFLTDEEELDKPFSDDEDSSTPLDSLSDGRKSNNNLAEDFKTSIHYAYQEFSELQARTKPVIAIFLTVECYKAFCLKSDLLQFEELAKEYPDMIDEKMVPWIEQTISHNSGNGSGDRAFDDLFPSTLQQAEKAGKELHSYLNITKRFKDNAKKRKAATKQNG